MSFLKSLFESLAPTVRADDDEEAEIVDPQKVLREKCKETKKCAALHEKLETCTDRVNSRTQTLETCSEEVIDYMSCIDHCAAKTLFHHLK